MHRQYNRTVSGFTLIELLVVISIIGMLSSVVLVSLQKAREKGVFASAQQFEGVIYRAWFTDASAVYDFEDLNGSETSDGTSNNSGVIECEDVTVVDGVKGLAMEFAGTGPRGCFDETYTYNKFSPTNGSLSVWVKPTTASFKIATVKGVDFYVSDGQVVLFGLGADLQSNARIPLNTWTHILFSWGAGETQIHINGREDNAANFIPPFLTSPVFHIGGSISGGEDHVILDSFAIYTKSPQQP